MLCKVLQNAQILDILNQLAEHDKVTFYHSIQVAQKAALMGCNLGFSDEKETELVLGSLLHDVGKLFIPVNILQKPGRLTDTEYQVIQQHPRFGKTYLEELGGFSDMVLHMVQYHHENYDGTGYLYAKRGDEVDESVRILRIADSFDAMVSERPYHPAVPVQKVQTLLLQDANRCYDPNMLQCITGMY